MADNASGRGIAEEKLIRAAGELLSEVGPRAASVRAVATRAGVNHGLIHHYFGSKESLLRAAMTRLVEDHAAFAKDMAKGASVPAPFALLHDQPYLRAVMRCVLDGEMELATTELDAGVSIPRHVVSELAAHRGQNTPDVKTQAAVGIGMAMEMGWAALEPFIFAVVGATPDEEASVRAEAVALRNAIARTWIGAAE